MTKLFHRLSTRIVLEILLAVAFSAAIYAGANAALTRFFQQYATEPAVFRRLSDRHFQDLQRFADENHLVSTDGKPFTQWNDRYHYVSLMIIRQNEALCYNSFVSYNMTYTEEDQEHFYWGSKVLPTYEYRLRLADETCKVYFSGYFDQAYTSLRKGICAGLFLISFVAGFYLLFQKHIRYIEEMEQNVSSLCSKNFSRQIPIRGSTELSTLAANINHLGDTIQLLLLTEDAKLKQKEQFVKSIAHDIRTPLTGIVGATNVLLEQDDTLTPQQRRELLKNANEDAQWLIHIVENLLSITRIGAGEDAQVTKTPEAAEEVIEGAVGKFRRRYPQIDVRVELPEEFFLVPMDPLLIQQVMTNLLENAAVHGVTTTRVVVSLEKQGKWARFTVCDNGRGIPEGRLHNLFDGTQSAQKGDSTRSMGIGLSVCKTVVAAHRGKIKGENIKGGGARFTVDLPLEEDEHEDQG